MRLATLLLLLIVAVHYSYAPLSVMYADPDQAGRNIFYVMRGVGGVVLFLLVWIRDKRVLVGALCAWGAIEEAQTAVCGLAVGIGNVPPALDLFEGLCGKHLYLAGVVAAAAFAMFLGRQKSERND